MLALRKEHIENLIDFAPGIKASGVDYLMNLEVFDMSKFDEYAAQAKPSWGNAPQYREFEEKSKNRNPEKEQKLSIQFMSLFKEFGKLY